MHLGLRGGAGDQKCSGKQGEDVPFHRANPCGCGRFGTLVTQEFGKLMAQ
jgi:hypothetical protein